MSLSFSETNWYRSSISNWTGKYGPKMREMGGNPLSTSTHSLQKRLYPSLLSRGWCSPRSPSLRTKNMEIFAQNWTHEYFEKRVSSFPMAVVFAVIIFEHAILSIRQAGSCRDFSSNTYIRDHVCRLWKTTDNQAHHHNCLSSRRPIESLPKPVEVSIMLNTVSANNFHVMLKTTLLEDGHSKPYSGPV